MKLRWGALSIVLVLSALMPRILAAQGTQNPAGKRSPGVLRQNYPNPFNPETRISFTIGDENREPITNVTLSLAPFRRIVKDYFMMCESYYQAIKTQPPSRIEAIDVSRRGLHDEGSRLLMERLKGKVGVDIATARRLFTLLCALHWKG